MDSKNSCDSVLAPRGPAFEDVVDFVRDENIFFRKYIESWHIATENGNLAPHWSDPVKGPQRHQHTEAELFDCTAENACDDSDHCHWINVGSAVETNDLFP